MSFLDLDLDLSWMAPQTDVLRRMDEAFDLWLNSGDGSTLGEWLEAVCA